MIRLPSPGAWLRQQVRNEVQRFFGEGQERIDLDTPIGDPGLFGPSSMAWRVHADLASMMAGGTAALLLQMLHPAALAGIWDHSRFREDRTGRLRRTAQFIAGTTYGATSEAERLIARVRAVHSRVSGTLPDGSAYRADDPALLCWVHVAESYSFLRAYRRYRAPWLLSADEDRYYGEVAIIAERLGARDVPVTRQSVSRYLEAMRRALCADERTREVARVLLSPGTTGPAALAAGAMTGAAIDLLPRWAARMHGLDPGLERHGARLALAGIGVVLRRSLTEGSAQRARRRIGGATHT